MKWIKGGVTSPKGFIAGGVHCGIKKELLDLAVVVSENEAVCAGCFTSNEVKAAPVIISKEHLTKSKTIKGVIINSGCANTCTGQEGFNNAKGMAKLSASLLGTFPEKMLVCSTGRIGVQLPMDKIESGIKQVAGELSIDGHKKAAEAIMTTDKVSKEAACTLVAGETEISIGGMAKGAGMIAPHMATMIAIITSDACVEPKFLQKALSESVDRSFNRITVDGDTSTNDSVIMLANGMAGNTIIDEQSPNAQAFKDALYAVCKELAFQIVKDGEGATKFIEIAVKGAKNQKSARSSAYIVANSLLLKVALHGSDPNWGRIMAAIGRSGSSIDPDTVDVYLNELKVVKNGVEVPDVLAQAQQIWRSKELVITIDLHLGEGSDSCYTCDISHEYIDINL